MNKKYEYFEILDPNSEEVKELEDRWVSGYVRYADEVKRKYSGYTDTGVYAILDENNAPVKYIDCYLHGIKKAYDEFIGG